VKDIIGADHTAYRGFIEARGFKINAFGGAKVREGRSG
jgi:hypothetical protein